jgi:hypothetical protein
MKEFVFNLPLFDRREFELPCVHLHKRLNITEVSKYGKFDLALELERTP